MPSTSDKQRRFMAAAAHDPKFAKQNKIPMTVAEEFNQADQADQANQANQANTGNTRRQKLVKAMKDMS